MNTEETMPFQPQPQQPQPEQAPPQPSQPFARVTTQWDLPRMKQAVNLAAGRRTTVIFAVAVAVSALFFTLGLLDFLLRAQNNRNAYSSCFFLIIAIWALFFVWKFRLNRAARQNLAQSPHRAAVMEFYPDHIHLHSFSDRSSHILNWGYGEIKEIRSDGEQIVLLGPGGFHMFVPAELEGDVPRVLSLLKSNVKRFSGPDWLFTGKGKRGLKGKSYTRWCRVLLAFFVLTCCAVPVGTLLCIFLSALENQPGFEGFYRGFCLVLPISILCVLLGDWAKRRGIPAKKELVAGCIVTAVLLLLALFFFSVG